MATRLLIRIAPDGRLFWLAPATATRGSGAPPVDLVAAAREIIALVPAEQVVLTCAELPHSSAARLARVLPYALEDQVLDPVDTLHFALGPVDAEGRHRVAVVARSTLAGWLQSLRDAGIQADAMLPDVLAVPRRDDHPALLLEGPRCLVRLDATHGFACDAGQLDAWLDAEQRMVPFDGHAGTEARRDVLPSAPAIDWIAPAGTGRAVSTLDILATGIGDGAAINVLQGEFAPHHRRAPQRRLWRIAAMLAIAAAVLGLAGRVVDVLRLSHASHAADDAIAAIYAQGFPSSPVVPDPVARMQSELQRAGGSGQGGGLMPLLTRLAPLLASQDYRLRLQGLEYRNGSLELALHAPSLAILDQLRERMATLAGIHAELAAATPGDDGVDGRLRIQEDGP